MENNVQTSKIGVRDLVNVAIFTVIYFVIFYVCAMTGFVPVMAVFYPVLTAIIAGIPCILFYTKVKSFGLVTIMGVLLGLIFFLMGYGYYALITGIVFGLLADVIMKAGKYKSWKAMLAGLMQYSVFGRSGHSYPCLSWAMLMLKCIVPAKVMPLQIASQP